MVREAGEASSQGAADLLGVARPYLIKLLDAGDIRYRRVGTRRRVPLRDLLLYRERRNVERRAALDDMTCEAEELGLYRS